MLSLLDSHSGDDDTIAAEILQEDAALAALEVMPDGAEATESSLLSLVRIEGEESDEAANRSDVRSLSLRRWPLLEDMVNYVNTLCLTRGFGIKTFPIEYSWVTSPQCVCALPSFTPPTGSSSAPNPSLSSVATSASPSPTLPPSSTLISIAASIPVCIAASIPSSISVPIPQSISTLISSLPPARSVYDTLGGWIKGYYNKRAIRTTVSHAYTAHKLAVLRKLSIYSVCPVDPDVDSMQYSCMCSAIAYIVYSTANSAVDSLTIVSVVLCSCSRSSFRC
jgi:hypothetical protein